MSTPTEMPLYYYSALARRFGWVVSQSLYNTGSKAECAGAHEVYAKLKGLQAMAVAAVELMDKVQAGLLEMESIGHDAPDSVGLPPGDDLFALAEIILAQANEGGITIGQSSFTRRKPDGNPDSP